MTYNVFGGTLSLTQSITTATSAAAAEAAVSNISVSPRTEIMNSNSRLPHGESMFLTKGSVGWAEILTQLSRS